MINICRDKDKIMAFMLLPEIKYYSMEHGADDITLSDIVTEGSECWLDYKSIGLISLHVESGCMAQFHPYILRSHKTEYNAMIKCFFLWFNENIDDSIVKLNVSIPDRFTGAISAARTAGMSEEGVDRLSYLSSAGPCDRLNFGILRGEL